MGFIIGIQVGFTSGVAIYESGEILYAASEERFSREKNDTQWPSRAIEYAIDKYDIAPTKIEKVVLASKNIFPREYLCKSHKYSVKDYIREQNEYFKPMLLGEGKKKTYFDIFSDKVDVEDSLYKDVIKEGEGNCAEIWNEWRIQKAIEAFGIDRERVYIANHEYAHAAYGIYGSKFNNYDDVMCVVIDGFGDECNASIYAVENNHIVQKKAYTNFNIGRIYRYITLLLGMKPNEHEFKVMGLAPYANEYTYKDSLSVFRKAYKFENGEISIDEELHDNYFYFLERLQGERFDGIAAGLQIHTEEITSELVKYWMTLLGKHKLVISGGVGLNIKANMNLGKLDCVHDLFVVGSSGDESLCIGAIFEWLDKQGRANEIHMLNSLYLGNEVEDELEAIESVDRNKYEIYYNPTNQQIAKMIADGYILGRVVGRMEFGARALGNRSILADPRKRATVDIINSKIKNRDFWMPFTPSILEGEEERFLYNPKGFDYPYMSISCETTDEGRRCLEAAIHPADKTARPQIVSPTSNRSYYELINEFKTITGVGALLNTSLNLHGFPIVRTAAEGLYVLDNSDLDGLILTNHLIIKKTSM